MQNEFIDEEIEIVVHPQNVDYTSRGKAISKETLTTNQTTTFTKKCIVILIACLCVVGAKLFVFNDQPLIVTNQNERQLQMEQSKRKIIPLEEIEQLDKIIKALPPSGKLIQESEKYWKIALHESFTTMLEEMRKVTMEYIESEWSEGNEILKKLERKGLAWAASSDGVFMNNYGPQHKAHITVKTDKEGAELEKFNKWKDDNKWKEDNKKEMNLNFDNAYLTFFERNYEKPLADIIKGGRMLQDGSKEIAAGYVVLGGIQIVDDKDRLVWSPHLTICAIGVIIKPKRKMNGEEREEFWNAVTRQIERQDAKTNAAQLKFHKEETKKSGKSPREQEVHEIWVKLLEKEQETKFEKIDAWIAAMSYDQIDAWIAVMSYDQMERTLTHFGSLDQSEFTEVQQYAKKQLESEISQTKLDAKSAKEKNFTGFQDFDLARLNRCMNYLWFQGECINPAVLGTVDGYLNARKRKLGIKRL